MNKIFYYHGYHFAPVRRFTAQEKNHRTDMERSDILKDYSYEEFYRAAENSKMDVFYCMETRESYVPCPTYFALLTEEMEHKIDECGCCRSAEERSEMLYTRDCHGIVMRLVCRNCYEKIMSQGYDGAYYTEADECIDDDY